MISCLGISGVFRMAELKEFSGLNGHINPDMYPDVDIGGERIIKEKVIGIYKPAEEVSYKNKKVLYSIVEEGEGSPGLYNGFILVPGYKASEPYWKDEIFDVDMGERLGDEKLLCSPRKELTCKVEIIDKKDLKNIEMLIRKVTGRNLPVNIWAD